MSIKKPKALENSMTETSQSVIDYSQVSKDWLYDAIEPSVYFYIIDEHEYKYFEKVAKEYFHRIGKTEYTEKELHFEIKIQARQLYDNAIKQLGYILLSTYKDVSNLKKRLIEDYYERVERDLSKFFGILVVKRWYNKYVLKSDYSIEIKTKLFNYLNSINAKRDNSRLLIDLILIQNNTIDADFLSARIDRAVEGRMKDGRMIKWQALFLGE